jgi:hypothetical protein
VDNWKNITNSQNSVRKKSFGGTFTFSNCHIIGLDTVSLVFLVSGFTHLKYLLIFLNKQNQPLAIFNILHFHFCYQTLGLIHLFLTIPSFVAFMTIITELPDIILVGKTRIWSGPPYALFTQGKERKWWSNSKWVKSADKTVRDLLHSAPYALYASSALFTLTHF